MAFAQSDTLLEKKLVPQSEAVTTLRNQFLFQSDTLLEKKLVPQSEAVTTLVDRASSHQSRRGRTIFN